ncbi:hypothetical protein ACH4T9_31270 [Micromonospora sp. NPDC020750]|uniref:hypothetical protein n=1 Tax=unclassified Micromonospora TaxID=2617518 RepID=UPI00379C11BF
MMSSQDLPDRIGGQHLGVTGEELAEHNKTTLKQLACEHPDRVNTRTLGDATDTWHCPACGANWRDAP